jgi:hypothetical protein
MKDFFQTPKTKTLLWTLCGILALLIIFGLGVVVGYRRAIFASTFGENYYRNFYGSQIPVPMGGVAGVGPMMPHGVVGEVIDVGSGTIAVKNDEGDEASIILLPNTSVREMDNDITPRGIVIGDRVAVIGEPNANGQVEARFIRVFKTP